MMRNIRLLLKYSLKGSKNAGKLQIPTPVRYLIFSVAMVLISASYAVAINQAYPMLVKTGKAPLLLELTLISGSLIIFVIGILSVLNNFFLAEDIDTYLPFPFKASEIVISKLITTLLYLYVYSLIIVLPLISYGTAANAGVTYYIFVGIIYLFNPIVPVVIGFIISSILMRVANLGKHKDAIRVLFSVVMVVFIIAIDVLFKSNNAGAQAANVVTKKEWLIKIVSKIFYNDKVEAKALVHAGTASGFINMGIAFLIIIVLVAVLYIVAEKMYLRSVQGFGEVSRPKTEKTREVKVKTSSVLKTLVLKELKVVYRTPVFLVNCVVMLFYIPLLYIFILSTNSQIHNRFWHVGYIVIGGTIFAVGIAMAAGAAAYTALSREGSNVIVSKYIPVSYKTQFKAKLIVAFLINSLILILGIGILIVEKVGVEIFIFSFILQILTCFMMTLFGMLNDYLSPKLVWETEKRLYKGNFKSLINMIGVAVPGIPVFIIAMLCHNTIITFIVAILILIILSGAMYFTLIKRLNKTYSLIE